MDARHYEAEEAGVAHLPEVLPRDCVAREKARRGERMMTSSPHVAKLMRARRTAFIAAMLPKPMAEALMEEVR